MSKTKLKLVYMEYKYKRALRIACELLNGDCLYGVDSKVLFEKLMDADVCVSSIDYEKFILQNLDRFDDNDNIRHKAMERLGW